MNAALLARRLLPWARRAKVPVRRRPAPAQPAEGADAPEERFHGCGWFDSSHELQRGLRVREDAAAELPLAAWLDWHAASSPVSTQA